MHSPVNDAAVRAQQWCTRSDIPGQSPKAAATGRRMRQRSFAAGSATGRRGGGEGRGVGERELGGEACCLKEADDGASQRAIRGQDAQALLNGLAGLADPCRAPHRPRQRALGAHQTLRTLKWPGCLWNNGCHVFAACPRGLPADAASPREAAHLVRLHEQRQKPVADRTRQQRRWRAAPGREALPPAPGRPQIARYAAIWKR